MDQAQKSDVIASILLKHPLSLPRPSAALPVTVNVYLAPSRVPEEQVSFLPR